MSRRVRDREKYESGSKWFCDWHREQPNDDAGLIDLDGCGYCRKCHRPLFLVEATEDTRRKNATVTEELGAPCQYCGMGGLEVFVFYRDTRRHPGQFLVDHRSAGINLGWLTYPDAWEVLMSVRRTHQCAMEVAS